MSTIIGKIIMANRSFMNYEFSLHKNRSLNDFLPDKRGIFLSALATLAVCLISILIADRPIALAMRSVAPSIRTFFSYVTLFGNSTPYLTFLGMIFILFYPASKSESWRSHAEVLRKYALFSFFIFVSIALSGILTDVLKVIFARYRPVMLYNERKYGFIFFRTSPAKLLSFPSGHANTIAAFMTALYLIKPRYRFIYLLIALMVMASRIVIGKHFVSDVVAGAYLGVLTTYYLRGFFLLHHVDIFSKHPHPVR